MRVRITLDEDVYQLVSLCAAGRGITFGAAVGVLVRKAMAGPQSRSRSSRTKTATNGLRVFSARGRVITPKMVKDASGG
jgi:hypothetical protein